MVRQPYGETGERRLQVAQTAYSSTLNDLGGGGGLFGLALQLPDAVTETAVTVALSQGMSVGCATNAAMTVTRR